MEKEKFEYIDADEILVIPERFQREYTQAVRDSSGMSRYFRMANYRSIGISILTIVLCTSLLKDKTIIPKSDARKVARENTASETKEKE
jgi:hypothetical protein